MDKKLEQWIAEQEAIKAKRRDEHLIALGLTDETKSYEKITYFTVEGRPITEEEAKELRNNGVRVETKIKKHYAPIQVSDEEYDLICHYMPERKCVSNMDAPSGKEYLRRIAKSTKTVATILVIYVILSVILGIVLALS